MRLKQSTKPNVGASYSGFYTINDYGLFGPSTQQKAESLVGYGVTPYEGLLFTAMYRQPHKLSER